MRKQFQIAAVVSAAALLAIGASMTSFAATGWQEEDGTWVYYNKAEEKVTDKWAKSGDNWFYLDGDGYMATDMLIEDDDDYYYVDANGAMVRNQWIAIDNEDAGNDDDEPEVHWYYFQNNGKAYRKKGSAAVFKKSINGKTYCFNQDGQMQYGWVSENSDGETDYDEEAWRVQGDQYYFGDENDGAMAVGWRLISIVDSGTPENDQPGDAFWDEDQDRWFYFKSSGKKEYLKDGKTFKGNKTINGRKYGFDEYGRMVADWYTDETYATASDEDATDSSGDKIQGNPDYSATFMYFSTPEDGARYTKGWFKVVPGYYLNQDKYDDGDNKWYYADGKGHIAAGEIKTIKSKKYAFDVKGDMIDGLAFLDLDSTDPKLITKKWSKDDYYSNEDDFKDLAISAVGGNSAFFFFSNDADHDGAMKTGKQTVNIDGDNYTFRFYDSGAHKGQGINGVKDKKIYLGGMLMKADSDDKFAFFNPAATDHKDLFYTFDQLKDEYFEGSYDTKKDEWTYTLKASKEAEFNDYFIPMNASGAILTSGTKKDGDDYKITLKGKHDVSFWGNTVSVGSVSKVVLK